MKRLLPILILALSPCSALGLNNTYTSQRAGNWSVLSGTASSPWYDGGTQTALNSKPGNNDAAVCNHTVHVDEDTTLGDDSANTRLSGTGTVEVDAGKTLTMKGRVISNNLSIINRGTFQFYGATNGYWAQVRKFTSVSGSTIKTTSLSGSNFGFFFGGAHNVTEIDIQDTTIDNLGSATFFNACGSPFVFKRNTITNSYKFIHTGSTATDPLDVQDNIWVGAPRDSISELRLVGMVAPTGGTKRNVSGNVFTHNNEFFGDLTDLQHLNNLYLASTIVCEFGQPGTTTTTGTNILSKNNVYVGDSWSTDLAYVYTAGRFTQNLFHLTGGHAAIGVHNDQAGTLEIDNNVFENGADSDTGQSIYIANDGLQANQTINAHHNIQRISPGGANVQSFILHAGLPKGLTLTIDDNTLAGNTIIGSYTTNNTWCHRAGMISSMKNNVLGAIASNTKYLLEEGPQQRSARIGVDVDCFDKGTLTSDATSTTFADTTASWGTIFTDTTAGTFYILFTSGPASGLATAITGNSSGTVGTVAAWNGGITPQNGNGYKIVQVALYSPSNVDYNCMNNHKTTGTIHRLDGTDTTSVKGHDGHWIASGTPGSHDIYADPQYYDSSRCLATYDTAATGLNNAAGTAWADTGNTYNVGDIVSRASSSVYGNQTINYRCILAHAPTGVANDAPGTGSAWRTYWQHATVYRIAQDRTIIGNMITWYFAGFRPLNTALRGAASDGTTPGAVEGQFARPQIIISKTKPGIWRERNWRAAETLLGVAP